MPEELTTVEVAEIIQPEPKSLMSFYIPLEKQLLHLEEFNESIVWNYKVVADNKAARSHVYKLRMLKNDIDRARKARKKEIDNAGKELVSRIQKMIDFHDAPLTEEKARIDGINSFIQEMADLVSRCSEHDSSSDIEDTIASLDDYRITDELAEFVEKAKKIKEEGLHILSGYKEISLEREADQKELEELRAEKVKREATEKKRLQDIEDSKQAEATPEPSTESSDAVPLFTAPKAENEAPDRPWDEEPEKWVSEHAETRIYLEILEALVCLHVPTPVAGTVTHAIIEGNIPFVKVGK